MPLRITTLWQNVCLVPQIIRILFCSLLQSGCEIFVNTFVCLLESLSVLIVRIDRHWGLIKQQKAIVQQTIYFFLFFPPFVSFFFLWHLLRFHFLFGGALIFAAQTEITTKILSTINTHTTFCLWERFFFLQKAFLFQKSQEMSQTCLRPQEIFWKIPVSSNKTRHANQISNTHVNDHMLFYVHLALGKDFGFLRFSASGLSVLLAGKKCRRCSGQK